MIQTLSAAFLNFSAAIEGRNEYGNMIALRLFRSLHSINHERGLAVRFKSNRFE
uniref:Uncharacterized protein LOC8273873 isoform X2 n=1 Tax=Rhizophora mucronata TaxID=61149 RepID=A0A2P2J8F9_RHIMU